MDWRSALRAKLVDAATAVRRVPSGGVVGVAPYSSSPLTLCRALAEAGARGEIKDVRVDHPASGFHWTDPEYAAAFTLYDNYATPPNRAACHAGEMEYVPISVWRAHELAPGFTTAPDVFLVPVSPPDARGYCSYGSGVWMSPALVDNAKCVIAEVQPDFIRTGGANFVHIDEIDVFVEGEEPPGGLAAPQPSAEMQASVETICNLVAAELVHDGDTLQMGVGTVSASLGSYLGFRNDLGVQTELITGGIAELVQSGVVNGRYKKWHPRKVVGAAITALPREELAMIDGNPAFELYDFGYTDDLRQLVQLENFVAVNNALVVDLTGQVSAEALDHRMYTGVGGQTVFMIAGAYSPGGKSISVLPSSSIPSSTGTRTSRIVSGLAPGTPITVPRTFVDYVVTEQGIAELCGKTQRERAHALAEIAHPDFRDELRAAARSMYGG